MSPLNLFLKFHFIQIHINKRNRDGESNIPLEYLTNCSLYHDSMFNTFTTENICNDQLILDGNIDIYENKNQVELWIDEIDKFIKII